MRKLVLFSAAAMAVLAASPAAAQATRTWVSGVGDDANPCSRTAPCKTFAGSISKTAAGGEINVMDAGGFGGVTITKSLTIIGRGHTAGALVSGTNAIVVNAAATDRVTIKGLDINGIGTGAQTSLSGVKILSAGRVILRDNDIYRFKAGVAFVPTSVGTRLIMSNNDVRDNGVGMFAAPGSNAATGLGVLLRNNDFTDNVCSAALSAHGANASTPNSNAGCGTAGPGSVINQSLTVSAFGNAFSDSDVGVFSRGQRATFELGDNTVTGNRTGLTAPDLGNLRSFGTNIISSNGATTAPTQTVAPS